MWLAVKTSRSSESRKRPGFVGAAARMEEIELAESSDENPVFDPTTHVSR